MMPRGSDQVLLPASPAFIALTLIGALLLNLLPMGRVAGAPDLVALALVFWNVHQPRRVGLGVAFMLGLLVDVNDGALLGQHALAYSLLSYFAITIHRRVLSFGVVLQAVHVLPLFALAHVVSIAVRLMAGDMAPPATLLLAPLFEALLWPLAVGLLLAPQRRAPDPDENRPL